MTSNGKNDNKRAATNPTFLLKNKSPIRNMRIIVPNEQTIENNVDEKSFTPRINWDAETM
jgi:hypothetical protein